MAKKKREDVTASAIEHVIGTRVGPYQAVLVADCVPNDWNMNRMRREIRDKLARGIQMLLDAVGHVPPIVVRPHPTEPGRFQIIDGFHRWDIFRDSGVEMIDAYILDVDTKTAMILTDTLNYLRGEADLDAEARYFQRLLTEGRMTTQAASEILPYTADEIQKSLDAYDLHVDVIEVPVDGADTTNAEDDPFIEMKFNVSRSQAEVIERELARVGTTIQGKNIRGRSLEYMAVTSSQTDLANLTGEEPEPRKKRRAR